MKEKAVEHLSFDVLVVGSGAAGLRAAIAAREKGLEVCVISKATPGKSTCTLVSGGVFAATPEGASPEGHMKRTLQAGRGINQKELVEILVAEGPLRLKELVEWGIKAKFYEGYLFSEGRAPIWGEEIVHCLLSKNKSLGIRLMGGLLVTGLKIQEGATAVVVYSAQSNKWLTINANALVLATGGAGALYLRHDNPKRMVGDGYILALKAGAVVQDMEFVQFYPMGLAEPGYPPFLIPPGIADSGRLYNNDGEEILEKYEIQERPAAERARDKLSQALFNEIYRKEGEVWLDLQGVSEDAWHRDPFSASTRKIFGERYGAMHRPVRIAPLAHHVMGGVSIDATGATSVPGLFAAGEVTGGLHGANRMGGNALTETVVFGARAGKSAAAWVKNNPDRHMPSLQADLEAQPLVHWKKTTKKSPARLIKKLREILWTDGGIIRSQYGLTRAVADLNEIQTEALGLEPGGDARELQRILELRFACRTAAIILQGALRREESRGAHFREDFPEQDDENWRGHLQVRLSSLGETVWSFKSI
jgi:succinate dehydrogenase/fumarate reductase flavoprotein subunit